jgi:outer membrane protein assembly factor BamB
LAVYRYLAETDTDSLTIAAMVRVAGLLLALGVVLAPPSADNWPQWRGPGGLAVGAGTDYPDTWSPTEHILWKTEIPGRGHSSPVVWGDRIFLTTAIEGDIVPGNKPPVHLGWDMKPGYVHPDSVGSDHANTLKALAVDANTGAIVWEHTVYDGPMYDDRHRKNTYASPTAVTDGSLVFMFFESAGLYAFDVGGTLRWKVDAGGIAKAGLGPGTSPVLFENLVIIQCDQEMGEKGSFIAAYDKATGKPVWRTDRTNRRSWATPLLITAGGRPELIASGAEAVIAYDPRTGRELWRSAGTKGHPIPSSAFGHGLVFAFAGNAENSKMVLAIRPGADGGDGDARVKWRYARGTAYVASPILYGDYLYLFTDTGITTCLDAMTGEVVYLGGRIPVPSTFTASPVAFGNKLLFTSEDGDTFVVRAGPVHEVLRTNSVGEPVYASPALADGMVFIRGERHLFAIK